MTLAHLVDAGIDCPTWSNRIPPLALRTAIRLHEQRFNCPRTSSMGRLFDAVASLIGVRDRVHFEGQAAMQLEWLATGVSPEGAYSFDLSEGSPLEFDTRPLIHEVVQAVQRGTDTERMARRFHSTLVAMIGQACERVRRTTGLEAVVLSGGVFQNALLTCEASACLTREGFRVYRHRLVPPGDGGLSLGQLATAAHSIG